MTKTELVKDFFVANQGVRWTANEVSEKLNIEYIDVIRTVADIRRTGFPVHSAGRSAYFYDRSRDVVMRSGVQVKAAKKRATRKPFIPAFQPTQKSGDILEIIRSDSKTLVLRDSENQILIATITQTI